VPHIKTGVGAIATQAVLNPFYGPQGLALLQAAASTEDTVKFLTNADDGRDHRQLLDAGSTICGGAPSRSGGNGAIKHGKAAAAMLSTAVGFRP
jgi:uncharacterized Ntn-hydrolase superfamily protein